MINGICEQKECLEELTGNEINKAMAKYPVIFQKGNAVIKRSIDIDAMTLLFILCKKTVINKNKKKTCEVVFHHDVGEFVCAITVKKVPLWVMKRFQPGKTDRQIFGEP